MSIISAIIYIFLLFGIPMGIIFGLVMLREEKQGIFKYGIVRFIAGFIVILIYLWLLGIMGITTLF